jgi:outer membrane protein OmpA-like peptidoglycan-associated protein
MQVGLALGLGALRDPGTPDFRAIFRIAYAPFKEPDTDRDGIYDANDACVTVPGIKTNDPRTNGCPPPRDRDGDGVMDPDDICPDTHMGPKPDPDRRGCPISDRDQDGVPDKDDICPDTHMGDRPDATRLGCPTPDRDGDKVLDPDDLCPDVPAGERPDPKRLGCPYIPTDRDGDGVMDDEDQCPDVPQGLQPDPDRKGCPAPDRDGDHVPDKIDACPDVPGSPDPDPAKNGCPGLVKMTDCSIDIAVPVFFATDKDVILPKSFPVLRSVAHALKTSPAIKRVSVEGHTDSQGKREHNLDLSDRRAHSVMTWLSGPGSIAAERLESHGYGPDQPVAPNNTAFGRAKNRRVEFRILEPKCDKNDKADGARAVAPPEPVKPAPGIKAPKATKKAFKRAGKHAR